MALGIQALTHKVEALETRMEQVLSLLQQIDEVMADLPSRTDLDQAMQQLQQQMADALPSAQDVADLRSDLALVAKIDPAQKGS